MDDHWVFWAFEQSYRGAPQWLTLEHETHNIEEDFRLVFSLGGKPPDQSLAGSDPFPCTLPPRR